MDAGIVFGLLREVWGLFGPILTPVAADVLVRRLRARRLRRGEGALVAVR
jgi:hypothetical protein